MTTTLSDRVTEELGRLERLESERTKATHDDYMRVVYSTTDGEELDPAAVARILQDCGKSVADLERDCATLIERRRERAALDLVPDRQAELSRLEEQIIELSGKRAADYEKATHELAVLCQRRDSLSTGLGFAGIGRQRLRETAWPHLKIERKGLHQKFTETVVGTSELEDYVRGLRDSIMASERTIAIAKERRSPIPKEDVERHKTQLKLTRVRLEDGERRLVEKRTKNEAILAEIADCERRMLEP